MKQELLIRFVSSEQRANEFISGSLHMSTLGNFWGPDFSEMKKGDRFTPAKFARDDFHEGTVFLQEKDKTKFPDDLKQVLIGNCLIRVEALKYCNLLCFYAVDYDDELNRINLPDIEYMKEHFGKYAVIINDKFEFIKRLEEALSEMKDVNYIMGRINYQDFINDDTVTEKDTIQLQTNILSDGLDNYIEGKEISDIFNKIKFLKKQKEWRLCVLRPELDGKAYKLRLKNNISDICTIIETEKINTYLKQKFPDYRYAMIQPQKPFEYNGNISREELSRKICGIDGKYRILANIG